MMRVSRLMPLAAALLAGCAVPATQQAVTPLAPAALGLTGAPAPLIAGDWWHGFGDPQPVSYTHLTLPTTILV